MVEDSSFLHKFPKQHNIPERTQSEHRSTLLSTLNQLKHGFEIPAVHDTVNYPIYTMQGYYPYLKSEQLEPVEQPLRDLLTAGMKVVQHLDKWVSAGGEFTPTDMTDPEQRERVAQGTQIFSVANLGNEFTGDYDRLNNPKSFFRAFLDKGQFAEYTMQFADTAITVVRRRYQDFQEQPIPSMMETMLTLAFPSHQSEVRIYHEVHQSKRKQEQNETFFIHCPQQAAHRNFEYDYRYERNYERPLQGKDEREMLWLAFASNLFDNGEEGDREQQEVWEPSNTVTRLQDTTALLQHALNCIPPQAQAKE